MSALLDLEITRKSRNEWPSFWGEDQLCNAPGLDEVISNSKEALGPALMQLAFAFRARNCGATALTLEPPALDGRKGDIRFTLDGHDYMVECYSPRLASQEDTSFQLHREFDRIFDACTSGVLRIRIRLLRSIITRERREIGDLVLSTLASLDGQGRGTSNRDFVEIEIDDIHGSSEAKDFDPVIDVDTKKPRYYENEDFGVSKHIVDAQELQDIRIHGYQGSPEHQILVWRAPEEKETLPLADRLPKLIRKIRNKLKQTRGIGDPSRLLIVQVGEDLEEFRSDSDLALELRDSILRNHTRVGGVLLVQRAWTTSKRFRYGGALVGGHQEHLLPQTFLDCLNDLDGEGSILDGWNSPIDD